MTQQSDLRSRREAMQRVQIGLVGFAVVLLVVALANIVIGAIKPDVDPTLAAQLGQGAGTIANATSPDNNEPFVDLGVTPKSDTASPAAPSVPDLEPDPRLSRPMDQDPKPARNLQQR